MRVVSVRRAASLVSPGVQQLRGVTASFKDFNEEARWLRKMADAYSRDRAIREWAVSIITAECPSRDKACQALAIARWVQKHVYYVHEGRETFQVPTTTLKGWQDGRAAGDCDDHSSLIAAGLGSIGIRCVLCIIKVAAKGAPPSTARWAHIFPVALIPTKDGIHRMTLDSTLREPVDELVNPIEKVTRSGRQVTEVKIV